MVGSAETSSLVGRLRSERMTALVALALIAGFVLEIYAFAQAQDIWLDESTQLTGAMLRLADMFRWLAGDDFLDSLGVPGDRMPPLSYLIDWGWLHLVGFDELGIRLFHSLFVIIAIAGLFFVVQRSMGPTAAIVALSFFILSPKLIQIGVEIRSYPIFFAISCLQTAVFATLVADENKLDVRWLAIFVLICLMAIYTHLYGVVSSCAFFLALGLAYIRSFAALSRIIAAFVVVIVGSLGILPFILASVDRSTSLADDDIRADRHLVYLLKLFGDPANGVSIAAALLFFGGLLLLLGACAIAILRRLRHRSLMPFDWLLVVFIAGVSVTLAASFVFSSFNPLVSNYSIWLFPLTGVLIAIGASSRIGFRPWDSGGRFVAIGMMLIGSAQATIMFLSNTNMFVHGPNRFIGALYDSAEDPKGIVYEPEALWKFPYFPLLFSHRNRIDQYRAFEGGKGLARIVRSMNDPGYQPITGIRPIKSALAQYKTILIVNVTLRSYQDVRECQDHGVECRRLATGPAELALTEGGQWREVKAERQFGLYDTQVKVLQNQYPIPR
jgi:hypothetical protein